MEPSTAPHATGEGGAGTTQLAGNRAITITAKATTASTVIQIPRRTLRSACVQYDCGVDHSGGAGLVDRSGVHPDAVLLGQPGQPHDERIE